MVDNRSTGPNFRHPVHVMAKPTGPACNLDCEYCFYLDKAALYPEQTDFTMSDETLEAFVRQYIEASPSPVVTFTWQGGEPTLLGVDFFRKVVEYQDEYSPENKEVRNTLQTNGTLLDEEWGEFLATHNFLVGVSIDGPRELHDRFRRTRSDEPTFDSVMDGLSVLQKYGVEHNALCVVNAFNSRYPLKVYEFFKKQGIEWIQFIPLVEPPSTGEIASDDTRREGRTARGSDIEDGHGIPSWVWERGGAVEDRDGDYESVAETAREVPTSDRSVDAEAYGEFMCTIFDEWVRNDVGDVSVRLFDQCLEVLLRGRASLCVLAETCGSQVALEHDGDVFACDHFVDPGFERGNIHDTHLADLVAAPEQRQFGEYKREGLPPRCRDCDVREFCHGGCPKNWHLKTPDGDPGLNYLCAGYRRFFTYVQPYLDVFEEIVEDGLPLSFVMDRVDVLDDRASE